MTSPVTALSVTEAPKATYGYGWIVAWSDGATTWYSDESIARFVAGRPRPDRPASIEELRAILGERCRSYTAERSEDGEHIDACQDCTMSVESCDRDGRCWAARARALLRRGQP